jgi:hypothetical protein
MKTLYNSSNETSDETSEEELEVDTSIPIQMNTMRKKIDKMPIMFYYYYVILCFPKCCHGHLKNEMLCFIIICVLFTRFFWYTSNKKHLKRKLKKGCNWDDMGTDTYGRSSDTPHYTSRGLKLGNLPYPHCMYKWGTLIQKT